MMKQKTFLVALVVCAVVAFSGFAQTLSEGAKAPDFDLMLSTGKKVRLSDYKGKAVLLHFWATWCPPCRRELPEMDSLAKGLPAGGNGKLVFLAVCVSDTEQSRSAFMKKYGYTFTGGLDESGEIAAKYNITGIPTSLLISPDGRIEKINIGAMNRSGISDFVKGYAD